MTRSRAYRSRTAERGWVFLSALLVLTVLFILGSSLIERSQNNLSAATLDNQAARSFHLAEKMVPYPDRDFVLEQRCGFHFSFSIRRRKEE